MERIALISDIHGNVPALEAVLNDCMNRNISRVFCLGDLVGKGPHPEVVVDLVRQHCEFVLQGNWDDHLSKPSEDHIDNWHQKRLGHDRMEYLGELPFSKEFYMSGRYIRLFHASSESVHNRVQPSDSMEKRLNLFSNTGKTNNEDGKEPDVVGYGDIHNAFIQHFDGKTLFNVGSVGNPLEIPQAAYMILEGEYGETITSSFSIQIVRVPYDIELAVKQAIGEDMPSKEPYVNELRTAIYRGRTTPRITSKS